MEVTRQDIDNIWRRISAEAEKMGSLAIEIANQGGELKAVKQKANRNETEIDMQEKTLKEVVSSFNQGLEALSGQVAEHNASVTQQIQAIEIDKARNEGSKMGRRELVSWVIGLPSLVTALVFIGDLLSK